jgi:hypothetical protein
MRRLSVAILKNHKFFCNTLLKYNTDNFKVIDNNKPINNIDCSKLEAKNNYSKSDKYNYRLDDKNKYRLEGIIIGFWIINIICVICILYLNSPEKQLLDKILREIINGYIVFCVSTILYIITM